MNDSASSWYVLHSRPRQETRAVEHLTRQGYHIYYPTIQVRKKRRGKVVEVTEALFPRYLFIQLGTQDNWTSVRSTRGVADFVRFGGVPARVPEALIDEIRLRLGDKQTSERLSNLPKAGDRVRLRAGQFADIEGILAETDGEKRCIVLIELLGRTHKIES